MNIWSKRNSYVFQGKITPLEVVAERVSTQVGEHGLYAKRIYSSSKSTAASSPRQWRNQKASSKLMSMLLFVMRGVWV